MKKNKLPIMLCASICAASCALGVTAFGANASTAAPSFVLHQGASIRVNNPAGIRFETKILKTEYENMSAKNAEYGTLVIPKTLLGENELTASVDAQGNVTADENVLIIKAKNINKSMQDDSATTENESLYNYYNAVVVGEKNDDGYADLAKEFYSMDLVARSYVVYDGENGKEVEYAENVTTRSIATVAKNGLLQNSNKYNPTEYAHLHDVTDYVAENNQLAEVKANKAALTPVCETELVGDEVKAVYVFGEDELVAAANWSYTDDTFAFTQEYFGALENGEYTYKLLTENSMYTLKVKVVEEYAATPAIEDGYNFETNAKLSEMVPDGVLNANTQSGTISKVEYADEGITVADTTNKYGVKIVADAGKSALVFRVNFGKQLNAGDKISFKFYVKKPASVTDTAKLMRLNAKVEYTDATSATRPQANLSKAYSGAATSFKYDTWLTCTFTLTQVNANDPNGIWVGMEYPNGISDYTGLTMYIDDVNLEEAIAATPAIDDGYNFESNAVLSDMVYDGVINGNANHQGVISRVKYSQENMSAPEGVNEYGVKITSSKQYLVFRLNFGKALSAGDVVSFKVYFVQPQDVTVAIPFKSKSEYNNVRSSNDNGRVYTALDGTGTSFGYGKWFICSFTVQQVSGNNPTSMWCNLTYPNGISDYTGLTMYIDDVTLIKAN